MNDQAEALRNLVRKRHEPASHERQTRIVTVTSGKGGVGKSNFSLNFALTLHKMGRKVLLFDADIGMANIDVLMGVTAKHSLYHLLRQEKTIWDIVQLGPQGLHFISGGSGLSDLLQLSEGQLNYFESEIAKLYGLYDVILFDTGAGLSKETVKFIAAAQETFVVTTPEPTSITDAYALIKMVSAMKIGAEFKLIVNRAGDRKEGAQTADKMVMAVKRFLNVDLQTLGIVADDPLVGKSVKKQIPFSVAFPSGEAVKGVEEIANRFLNAPAAAAAAHGGVRGFVQRMFRLIK
ncbi:MinD/ParA family protein [Paenibacillus beijingensis]|uniref:Cobyrinic acid a,c-diamide synthase n=1 Tax=Paenibacillus beijingensis TaxID=1126833 RepID=A0A0D5NMS8_9BACL|nr:MinD/ParA family protein [Paenibacillus beijingensis]AJY76586.1 cobyrinic acid a,c-diamide synthase [Paenibacillus beijingensis]